MTIKKIIKLCYQSPCSGKLKTRNINGSFKQGIELYCGDFIAPAGATGFFITKNSIYKIIVDMNMDTQYFNLKKMLPFDCNICLNQIVKISSSLATPK
jgi:hypothetical protein